MVMTGMIFQFNSDEGTGLIMLSDGEKKEFSRDDWVDESNMPAVGLKISYESSGESVKIKVSSDEDTNNTLPNEKRSEEADQTSFSSIEAFQNYFGDKGFDVIKRTQESSDEGLSMGRFSDGMVESVSIDFKDPNLEITKTTITLSEADSYVQYFKDTGYRLINDSDENGSRKVTLRRYVMDEHSEVVIKGGDDDVTVTKTVNGQKVF